MTTPVYYAFPGDIEVLDISQHLTGNAAQIVQYVARSSRLDGRAKGKNLADRRPDPRGKPGPKRSIGRMSKHEIDEWIASGGAA